MYDYFSSQEQLENAIFQVESLKTVIINQLSGNDYTKILTVHNMMGDFYTFIGVFICIYLLVYLLVIQPQYSEFFLKIYEIILPLNSSWEENDICLGKNT